MHVDIYKSKDDCTNSGISSRKIKGLCITNVPNSPHKPDKEYPAAKLVVRKFNFGSCISIVPEEIENEKYMFGGNFAYTSDGRFGKAIDIMLGLPFGQQHCFGAIAIHDRVE